MTDKIQAVIWDLDGVIIDSAQDHLRAWERLAQETHVAFTEEQFWSTFGQRNDAIIPQFWHNPTPERLKELADRKEEYYRESARHTASYLPGAQELLRSLHEAGYPQAVASSAPRENIALISDVLGLQRYITELVSGETVPHGKPAPDIFLKAAEKLGVEPDSCLVIEDAVAGVQAAHAGGMRCISVVGERDLSGLYAAELPVKDLTEVSVAKIRELA